MALVVFLQEDEDVPSVNPNLKIFCETAPKYLMSSIYHIMTLDEDQDIFLVTSVINSL